METKTKAKTPRKAAAQAPTATATPEGEAPGGGTFIVRSDTGVAGTAAPTAPGLRPETLAAFDATNPHHVKGARNFAALVAALRTLPQRPGDGYADPEAWVGVDPEGYPEGLLGGAQYVGDTVGETFDLYARLVPAFADLLDTPAFVRFGLTHPEEFVPEWREEPLRIGFGLVTGHGEPSRTADGWVLYRCAISDRYFAAPEGAPVPCLYYGYFVTDEGGRSADPREAQECPLDRNPSTAPVHPALVIAGREALAARIVRRAHAALEDLHHEIERVTQAATLASGLSPDDLGGTTETAAALVSWRQGGDGGGFERVPAGWRDVPKGPAL